MSEHTLSITSLNDFIFCPASIFFHNLDYNTDNLTFQCDDQLNGKAAHETVDNYTYSTSAGILTGIAVYSEKYGLFGKIDILDVEKKLLTERKKHIKSGFDGYVFQLYAQYFALTEMGYVIERLRLYSMVDNKAYPIPLPDEDPAMVDKFERTIAEINSFRFEHFVQSENTKCNRCIYEPLCPFSAIKEEK